MPTPTTSELRARFDATVADADTLNFENIGAAYRALVNDALAHPMRGAMLRATVVKLRDRPGSLPDVGRGDAVLARLVMSDDVLTDDATLGVKLIAHLLEDDGQHDRPGARLKDALSAAAYSWNAIGTPNEQSLLRVLWINKLRDFLNSLVTTLDQTDPASDGQHPSSSSDEWDPRRIRFAKELANMTWSHIWQNPGTTVRLATEMTPHLRHALLISSRPENPAVLERVFGGTNLLDHYPA